MSRHAPPRGPVITARRLWWADTVAVVVLATVATAAALAPGPRVHTAADTLPAPTSPPLRTGVVTLDAGPLVVPSIGAVEESEPALDLNSTPQRSGRPENALSGPRSVPRVSVHAPTVTSAPAATTEASSATVAPTTPPAATAPATAMPPPTTTAPTTTAPTTTTETTTTSDPLATLISEATTTEEET